LFPAYVFVRDHHANADRRRLLDKGDGSMNGISRRRALRTGAAGLAAAAATAGFNKSGIAAISNTSAVPLRAIVTLGGATYEYRENLGKPLGDFVSTIGGFTQACIRSDVSGSPLTVYFRPDRTSDRTEVVFELGRVFNATPANLGQYTVVIYRGDVLLATIDVPAHYWFSRWRWQSAPRPIVGDVTALITQNLLPPYDRAGALATVATGGAATSTSTSTSATSGNSTTVCTTTTIIPSEVSTTTPTTNVTTPYAIMGMAGLTLYMPQTGERQEIGIVTEAQGEYICTARQTALDRMRAQAEAAGTVPWHIRDETTNAPIDLKKYPGATWYPGTASGQPYVKTAKTPVTIDSAHQPALAYLPYILTGDPYHLEDLQFQATWNLGWFVPQYRLSIPQARTFAWNLRSLAQCARITPNTVPSWLLPRQYWTDFLADHRRFFEDEFVNNLSPERIRFRSTKYLASSGEEGPTAPKGTWIDPWAEDFLATVIGWVVAMGFVEWQFAFDWKIGSTIARTGRTSGWIRAHATPYRVILRATATSPIAQDWAAAWALQQSVNKVVYTDPNAWVLPDMTYLSYSRGALVYADKLKSGFMTDNLSWATGQLNLQKWKTAYKWRLGTGLV